MTNDAKKDEKPEAKEKKVDVAREPEKTVDVDERTREILRLVNNGARTISDALGQLEAAASDAKEYAAFYGETRKKIHELSQRIRNAAMNCAVAAAEQNG